MRTTLTIDDDLAGILRHQSRKLDKSFKELVNTALRKGLMENDILPESKVVTRPLPLGLRPGFDPDRMNQLVDELEAGDYLRKAAKDDSAGC
jgi:hypothetical protein